MCQSCAAKATGKSDMKLSWFSQLMGFLACHHPPDCTCDNCQEYRSENPYADTGFLLRRGYPTEEA